MGYWGKYRKVQKYFTPIVKAATEIDKDGNESVATISYNMKFICNARFMTNLVDNVTEGIHKIKCKNYNCFLGYESTKDNLIKYRFLFIFK